MAGNLSFRSALRTNDAPDVPKRVLQPILLVEDNAIDIELALVALEVCGVENEVIVVRDGAEALDYLYGQGAYADLRPVQPAVILMDLKLPKLTGLEVLRIIKRDPALKAVPVVMLTSSREQQDLLDSYESQVNAYVVKPIKFDQFSDAIAGLSKFWTLRNEPPPLPAFGAAGTAAPA